MKLPRIDKIEPKQLNGQKMNDRLLFLTMIQCYDTFFEELRFLQFDAKVCGGMSLTCAYM